MRWFITLLGLTALATTQETASLDDARDARQGRPMKIEEMGQLRPAVPTQRTTSAIAVLSLEFEGGQVLPLSIKASR